MNNHERYPTPESNVPKRHPGRPDDLITGDKYKKRPPGDWLGGCLRNDISLGLIIPSEESAQDKEVDKIEFLDSFYRQYPELRPKRKK